MKTKQVDYTGTVGERVRIDARIFNRDNATGTETADEPGVFTAKAYRPGIEVETLVATADGTGERHFYVNLTTEGLTEVEALTDPDDPDGLKGIAIWRAWANPKVS